MSLPTPNYILMEKVVVARNMFDEKSLEAGSFVRPIEAVYLPKHVKDTTEFKWHNPDTECFCYTHYGIVCILKSKLRKV